MIAERGSLTLAARELGITQPGLSRQMQKLERLVGVPLFTRTRNGVRLTPAGERYRAYAEEVLTRHRQLLAELRASEATLAGELRIAASTTPGEFLVPRLVGRVEMYSVKAINVHFWMATIGIVLYIAAMWIAGVMQGLMWRAVSEDGTLTYSFVESVKATYPFYAIRLAGGVIYLAGMCLMAWNVAKTMLAGKSVDAPIPAAVAHA